MANPQIKLKRSSTQNKRPIPDNVPLGELALNTYDGYLYASKDVGAGTTIITVNPWRVGTGTDSYDINFTAGNVGINSASPTALLDVNGDVNISGDVSFGSTTNIVKKVTDINSWVIKDTSFSVSAEQTVALGLYFKPDGTKMFVTGSQSPRDIEEYGLSSAWDITSASHTTAYSVTSQDTSPQGLFFSPNGENMFFVGAANDNVYHYTLSTGWDLSSTITYVGSFDVSSQDATPTGLTFGDSGTKMYVVGRGNDNIYQYNLSSAYTITSGVGIAHTLNIGASSIIVPNGFGNPHGISISSDGTKIWIVGTGEDRISQINLSTAYDLSTASYSNDLVGIGWYSTTPNDIYVNESAEKAFVVDSGGDDIHEIDITTSGLSIEANPTAASANINLNNNVQVKGQTWFDDRIIVNGSGTSWFQHNVQIQGSLTLRGIVDLSDGNGDRIQFGGSDDAKIYYDGTDNFFDLVFSSADNNGLRILDISESELLRVTNDGKVGINSESPTAKLDVNGDANISGVVTATGFSTSSGTSSQFLKADGSVDSSTYLTSETQTLDDVVGLGSTTSQTITVGTATTGVIIRPDGTLNVTGVSTLGVTTATDLTLQQLNVSGVSTFATTVSIGTTIDIIPYDNLGTLSFEGSAGQLFSITNNLTSGSIFSVNDISGLPSIDVDADGTIQLAPVGAGESVGIGTTNPKYKLHVVGDTNIDGTFTVNGAAISSGGAGAGATVSIGDSPPSSPVDGQLWWKSDTAIGHVYYNDGSNSQWVQFNGGVSGGSSDSGSGSSGVGTSRFTVSGSTGSIGAGTTTDITLTGAKAYSLFKIETSKAAWIRLYTDATSRTSDASREYTTDPTPGSGVLAEVYTTTSGISTFKMTPAVIGWNDDSTPSTNIYAKVTNNESTSQDISVTLTILRMEES